MKLHKQVLVRITAFRALLRDGLWRNEPHNPFKRLSQQEIGIVVIVGIAIAIVVVIATVAIVSLFPISDISKCKVLFGLGIASWFIGYWVLTRKRIPPKSQTRKPATVKPITHSIDVCNGSNEINKNFCHIPDQPNQATAISNAPTIKQIKTTSALFMLSSFPLIFVDKNFSRY